jgi:hypothetical protein
MKFLDPDMKIVKVITPPTREWYSQILQEDLVDNDDEDLQCEHRLLGFESANSVMGLSNHFQEADNADSL